jgi:hypothetical protein
VLLPVCLLAACTLLQPNSIAHELNAVACVGAGLAPSGLLTDSTVAFDADLPGAFNTPVTPQHRAVRCAVLLPVCLLAACTLLQPDCLAHELHAVACVGVGLAPQWSFGWQKPLMLIFKVRSERHWQLPHNPKQYAVLLLPLHLLAACTLLQADCLAHELYAIACVGVWLAPQWSLGWWKPLMLIFRRSRCVQKGSDPTTHSNTLRSATCSAPTCCLHAASAELSRPPAECRCRCRS